MKLFELQGSTRVENETRGERLSQMDKASNRGIKLTFYSKTLK